FIVNFSCDFPMNETRPRQSMMKFRIRNGLLKVYCRERSSNYFFEFEIGIWKFYFSIHYLYVTCYNSLNFNLVKMGLYAPCFRPDNNLEIRSLEYIDCTVCILGFIVYFFTIRAIGKPIQAIKIMMANTISGHCGF